MNTPSRASRRAWLASLAISALPLLSTACAPGIYYDPANYAKEYDPRKHEYIVGVGDTVKITVWHTPDLSTSETVRPDGTITLALIGEVRAADRTALEIRDAVKERLGEFIKDESAVVTCAVSAVNSYRFVVSGNVARPGTFTSKYYVTLAEAIAMAGGPSRFADTSSVLLLRVEASGNVRRIPVDYDKVSSLEAPEQNLVLARGDTVYVP